MPKISFLIPAYNYEQYLARCVDSVLAQTDPDWDLLLVDDCSTDGTWALCARYAAANPRIRAVSLQQNLGQYQIINQYSGNLRGEYACVLDADDYLAPAYVAQMYARAKGGDFDVLMCLHRNIAANRSLFVYNYGPMIHSRGQRDQLLRDLLYLEYFIIDCGTLVRTRLRRQIYEHLPKISLYAATDDMQALFLARHARNLGVLKKPLYYHNQESAGTWRNKSENFRLRKISSALSSLQMVYHLANNDAELRDLPLDGLPMVQNIRAKILETLGGLSLSERGNFYRKLMAFLAKQDLPFRFSGLSFLGLELHLHSHLHLQSRIPAAHSENAPAVERGWTPAELARARIKQYLRTLKYFLPKACLRHWQDKKVVQGLLPQDLFSGSFPQMNLQAALQVAGPGEESAGAAKSPETEFPETDAAGSARDDAQVAQIAEHCARLFELWLQAALPPEQLAQSLVTELLPAGEALLLQAAEGAEDYGFAPSDRYLLIALARGAGSSGARYSPKSS